MNFKRPLILASNSPRRQYLMRELGYHFAIQKPFGDESFPTDIPAEDVPEYLAKKKANSINQVSDEIVMTSDTVVILNGEILNKPADRNEAIEMLTRLAGNTHTVVTGVCLKDQSKIECFHDRTEVTFKSLERYEIENYV
ncbi:MAG: Maf family protein, partial [Cyclobacteriaceae bacterium]